MILDRRELLVGACAAPFAGSPYARALAEQYGGPLDPSEAHRMAVAECLRLHRRITPMLRRMDPTRARSFKVPAVWVIAPLTILGCVFLFLNLPTAAMLFLPGWGLLGIVIYFLYSRSRSHLGRGIVEVVDEIGGEETMIPIHPPKD